MDEKPCSICGRMLPLIAYHRRRHYTASGRRAACIDCSREAAREARKRRPRKRDPHKRRVRRRTRAAVRRGDLHRQPCEHCASTHKIQAHHPSYEGEDAHLKIIWLCPGCHALEHGVRGWTRQLWLPLRESWAGKP